MENQIYTLRPLNAGDAFMLLRIFKKLDWKELKSCFDMEQVNQMVLKARQNKADNPDRQEGNQGSQADKTADADALTVELGFTIAMNAAEFLLTHLDGAEMEIMSFLGGLSGMKPQEVAALPLAVFGSMVADVFRDKGFPDFFTAVTRLMK